MRFYQQRVETRARGIIQFPNENIYQPQEEEVFRIMIQCTGVGEFKN